MARDCYSEYSQDRRFSGKKIMTPTDNYLIGEWKSINYEGAAHYVPSGAITIEWDFSNQSIIIELGFRRSPFFSVQSVALKNRNQKYVEVARAPNKRSLMFPHNHYCRE